MTFKTRCERHWSFHLGLSLELLTLGESAVMSWGQSSGKKLRAPANSLHQLTIHFRESSWKRTFKTSLHMPVALAEIVTQPHERSQGVTSQTPPKFLTQRKCDMKSIYYWFKSLNFWIVCYLAKKTLSSVIILTANRSHLRIRSMEITKPNKIYDSWWKI